MASQNISLKFLKMKKRDRNFISLKVPSSDGSGTGDGLARVANHGEFRGNHLVLTDAAHRVHIRVATRLKVLKWPFLKKSLVKFVSP